MGIFNFFKRRRRKIKPERRMLSEEELEEIRKKNEELEHIKITFVPKLCPKCGSMMSVRKLGVWGYWCNECEFWWGTYDPYPIVKKGDKKQEQKK